MKRFWKSVSVDREGESWAIQLDGRPAKTPARAPLAVPTRALADSVAEEWRAVGETIDPRAMPLTGIANAAIDRVAPHRQAFAEGVARYAEGDLLCYRAEGPSGLIKRQDKHWDPLLAWARRRYDVDFVSTQGLMHVEQARATVDQLSHAVGALDSFHLAGLSPMTTISGSLIAALAVLEGAVPAESAWDAVSVDERWQLEQWGSDAEAEAVLENRRGDFLTAAEFVNLLN